MYSLLHEALLDSLRMVPFLLVIYFVIEWVETRFGQKLQRGIQRAGKAGPLFGALFGCVPQCGFSVVGSALYTKRFVTTGTLLAVYLSTSDEAVPIIIAHPERIGVLLPLLLTKVLLAIVAGLLIDLLWRRSRVPVAPAVVKEPVAVGSVAEHRHGGEMHADEMHDVEDFHVDACCGHHVAEGHPSHAHWWHPLRHTAQVFLFIFIISAVLNYAIAAVGEEKLGEVLLGGSFWQPIITALVGLIPNCAASVAITEVYLNGGISFGATIAGLSSSAGVGLLVLMKENGSLRDTLRILGLLLGISMLVGILLQYLAPWLPAVLTR